MLKRWATPLTILLGGCLAGCPAMPEVFCDGVLLEDATSTELTQRWLELELDGLLGDDDD